MALTKDERRGLYAAPEARIRPLAEIIADDPHERSRRRMRPAQLAAALDPDGGGPEAVCPYVCRGLPYHDPHGICVSGCWEEPSCITNGPVEGGYADGLAHAWDALGRLVSDRRWYWEARWQLEDRAERARLDGRG